MHSTPFTVYPLYIVYPFTVYPFKIQSTPSLSIPLHTVYPLRCLSPLHTVYPLHCLSFYTQSTILFTYGLPPLHSIYPLHCLSLYIQSTAFTVYPFTHSLPPSLSTPFAYSLPPSLSIPFTYSLPLHCLSLYILSTPFTAYPFTYSLSLSLSFPFTSSLPPFQGEFPWLPTKQMVYTHSISSHHFHQGSQYGHHTSVACQYTFPCRSGTDLSDTWQKLGRQKEVWWDVWSLSALMCLKFLFLFMGSGFRKHKCYFKAKVC